MATPGRTPLLIALIVVSLIALLEGLVIVFLLAAGITRPVATQTEAPTPAAQVVQGASSTSTPESAGPTSEAPPPSGTGGPVRGKVGERIESAGFVVTVLSVHDEPDPDLANILDLNEDQRYIATEVLLENETPDGFFYGGSQFRLKDNEDFEYVATLDYRQPGIGLGTIVPGERVRGFLSFIVPKEASGLNLTYQAPTGGDYRTIYVSIDS
jgi:hypothetical protein